MLFCCTSLANGETGKRGGGGMYCVREGGGENGGDRGGGQKEGDIYTKYI